MRIETIVVGQLDTNCILIADAAAGSALVVDPGDEPDRIIAPLTAHGLKPSHIIFTHAHYDHVCAARELQELYQCPIVMHAGDGRTYDDTKERCISWGYAPEDFPPPGILAEDGGEIQSGSMSFRVLHTPGHSPGSICLYGNGLLITGDTLFRGSAGRTDLPGGNPADLIRSLKKLMQFSPATRVLCGHGDETTIGRELRSNPFCIS